MYAIYTKHITCLSFDTGDCARYTAIKRNILVSAYSLNFSNRSYPCGTMNRWITRYFSCPVTYLHSQMRSVLELSRLCSRSRFSCRMLNILKVTL